MKIIFSIQRTIVERDCSEQHTPMKSRRTTTKNKITSSDHVVLSLSHDFSLFHNLATDDTPLSQSGCAIEKRVRKIFEPSMKHYNIPSHPHNGNVWFQWMEIYHCHVHWLRAANIILCTVYQLDLLNKWNCVRVFIFTVGVRCMVCACRLSPI